MWHCFLCGTWNGNECTYHINKLDISITGITKQVSTLWSTGIVTSVRPSALALRTHPFKKSLITEPVPTNHCNSISYTTSGSNTVSYFKF